MYVTDETHKRMGHIGNVKKMSKSLVLLHLLCVMSYVLSIAECDLVFHALHAGSSSAFKNIW